MTSGIGIGNVYRIILIGKSLFRNTYAKSFICRFSSNTETPIALRSLKLKSRQNSTSDYVATKNVRAVGGKGGDGCISFLQLWSNQEAGPDGGDGGNGAHVIVQACNEVKDLGGISTVITGDPGKPGRNKNCHGASAKAKVIYVPVGTEVCSTGGHLVISLEVDGAAYLLARGGAGGHGNAFFATATEQTPLVAQYGAEGETNSFQLHMKAIGHFALVGEVNAGKSSLIRSVSRARPLVSQIPGSTQLPQVGIVNYSDYIQLRLIDLPGLGNPWTDLMIHRCPAIVLLLDLEHPDPLSVAKSIIPQLPPVPRIIAANKIDLSQSQAKLEDLKKALIGEEVIGISAKFGQNLSHLLSRLRAIHDENSLPTL